MQNSTRARRDSQRDGTSSLSRNAGFTNEPTRSAPRLRRHWEAGLRGSSADWFKAGVARHRVGPTSLGLELRACTIRNKLLPPFLPHPFPSPALSDVHDAQAGADLARASLAL